MTIQPIDYDAVWKEVVQHLFRDTLAFLFPDVEALVDWSVKPTFLNVELPKLNPLVPRGMRRPDVVAQVRLRDQQSALVVLHTEIQVSPDPQFAERMFVYFYHLRERHRLPVMSLAILADTNPSWRPTSYEYRFGQTYARFEYQVVKLLDLEAKAYQEEANPIALFVQAHLASLKLRGDLRLMAEEKKRLFRKMLEQGYNSPHIRYLYQVVDQFMSLPYDLEREVEAVIEEMKRRRRRKWIGPQERLAVERGLRQGLEEGLQQAILNTLQVRFGELPEETRPLLERVPDVETLNRLHLFSVQVESLERFLSELRNTVSEG